MKYIKLFAIFAAVVVGLIVALNMDSIFHIGDDGSDFVKTDKIDIEKLCQKIEAQWKEARQWDSTLYLTCRADIEQKKGMKLMSEKGYERVHNTLFECAANKLRDSFSASLRAEGYSDAKVREYHAGAVLLAKQEGIKDLNTQTRLSHIEDLFNLYCDIYKFVNSTHAIGASFSPKSIDITNNKYGWSSFDTRKQNEADRATAFKKKDLYKEMNTIPGFEDGLKEAVVKQACEKSRDNFYMDLSTKIIKHFTDYKVAKPDTNNVNHIQIPSGWVDRLKLTDENLAKLGGIYVEFHRQTPGVGDSQLSTFKTNYGKDLNAMKEAIKNKENINNQ